jgi:hypothetical protein
MVDTHNPPSSADLQKWKQDLLQRADELKVEIRLRQVELSQVEERITLVSRLIAVDSADSPTSEIESRDLTIPKLTSESPRLSNEGELEDEVEALLRSAGGPMHISSIRESLIANGVQIPGRGDEANIIVRIRKIPDRFTRTARGTYALPEWGIPEMATKTTRAKRGARR